MQNTTYKKILIKDKIETHSPQAHKKDEKLK